MFFLPRSTLINLKGGILVLVWLVFIQWNSLFFSVSLLFTVSASVLVSGCPLTVCSSGPKSCLGCSLVFVLKSFQYVLPGVVCERHAEHI